MPEGKARLERKKGRWIWLGYLFVNCFKRLCGLSKTVFIFAQLQQITVTIFYS
jgi:hypothetical protein